MFTAKISTFGINSNITLLTQSLNINPKMPAVISRRSKIARNIAYAARRAVFSRKAPTHPVKPMRNVMAPFKDMKNIL